MKRTFNIILALALILSLSAVIALGSSRYKDTDGHWAYERIERWSDYGVISGSDGNFYPNNNITRGEFAVVLNRTLKYQQKAENTFSDLDNNFYTDSILALNFAKVMQGDGVSIRPKDSLTREEAAVMICRSLGIEGEDKANKTFPDENKISSWAKPYLNAMINKGLMNGSDGKLNPKMTIKRAEVVTIMDNAVLPLLNDGANARNLKTSKILLISAGNVVVTDSEIENDVIISSGVTNAEIYFSNVKISGDIIIDNDREGFITLDKCNVQDKSISGHKAVKSATFSDQTPAIPGGTGGGVVNGNSSPQKTATPKPTATATAKPTQTASPSATASPSVTKTPTPTEEPEPTLSPDEYKEINKTMVENLQLVVDDIEPFLDRENEDLYNVFYSDERVVLSRIRSCMIKVITYADKEIIDEDFVRNTEPFKSDIAYCKGIYDEMVAAGTDGTFVEKVGIYLNWATIEWLAIAFGIM